MIIPIQDPGPDLAARLARFEAAFTYPLGAGSSFSISHAPRYDAFFASLGDACCLALVPDRGATGGPGSGGGADGAGTADVCGTPNLPILGTIAAARRRLVQADGSELAILYVGDLKIAPAARGSLALVRLAQGLVRWAGPDTRAYAVVMGGSERDPPSYSGRAGIPRFDQLASLALMRISCPGAASVAVAGGSSLEQVSIAYRRLAKGRCALASGSVRQRSLMDPWALVAPDGSACGVLEDTARCKRLIDAAGTEIRVGHISSFAYATPAAGARVVRSLAGVAARTGLRQLFVAVPAADAESLRQQVALPAEVFAATVYGHGLSAGAAWLVNSSEI